MEKLVYKNYHNLFLLKPSSKVLTQKVSLNVYKKLLKVKFFCIFLPSNQKLALKYCIFIKIDSNFSNFITIWFDKFFETGKFELKSHIVHWRYQQLIFANLLIVLRSLFRANCSSTREGATKQVNKNPFRRLRGP